MLGVVLPSLPLPILIRLFGVSSSAFMLLVDATVETIDKQCVCPDGKHIVTGTHQTGEKQHSCIILS